MLDKALLVLWCVALLETPPPAYSHPVSGQAIQLDVTPASGSGNQVRTHSISCTLNSSLTAMEKVTALTVYASKPYGKAGEFAPLASVDLWNSDPQVLNDVEASDVDVFGRIGTADNTKSQLVFSWKSPRNGQASQYKCIANGLDRNGRVVTISITSDAAMPSGSTSDGTSKDYLRLLTKNIMSGVANTTTEIEQSVHTVDTNVEKLQKNVDSLGEQLKTQNSTIEKLQESITSFTELYKLSYLMSNFDVSEVHRGSKYFVSRTVSPFNIQAADSLCSMLGGYLVEIDDDDEFNFVLKFVKHVGGARNFFTGGNDIEEEGVFKFWHSKRPVTFFTWGAASEPSNSLNNEHCIEIRFDHDRYNDWVCNSKAKYVCEAPA